MWNNINRYNQLNATITVQEIFTIFYNLWLTATLNLLLCWVFANQVTNYFLPESLVFTRARILFFVSLLFVALLDPFDPYSPFKFKFFYYSCSNSAFLSSVILT